VGVQALHTHQPPIIEKIRMPVQNIEIDDENKRTPVLARERMGGEKRGCL
jgi:Arc/MetJ family transcription regulator